MSCDALERTECPFNWEDITYLEGFERDQLVDRLPLCPKNWRRVLDLLLVSYFEAVEDNFADAKSHLKDAYTGILEPFADLYVCGSCIFYRDAMKHVLDATWAHVLKLELSESNENWKDTPEGQALSKFIDCITPAASFNYQQRAALCAIRAHFHYDPENLFWIQKAIHLSPAEAQWYIDLANMRWSEDPLEPHFPPADSEDCWLVTKSINLITSRSSPSHGVKGGMRNAMQDVVKRIADKMRLKCKKFDLDKDANFPQVWVLDLELLRLMARTLLRTLDRDPRLGPVKCTRARQHRKKCVCLPEWVQNMLEWMVMGQLLVSVHSPVKPDQSPLPVYPTLVASLVEQEAGDVDNAREGLQKVCNAAPSCQYAHMRLAVALGLRPNRLHDKAVASRALEHAKKCEDLYPEVTDWVEDCIEAARALAAAPAKPAICVRKAGRRW
ncbi:Protein SLY1 [Frankliniella fusca]|uniref:Protein SLY1 n=1 Tax=Frankliniella fusca TaxID=407009 RepID=A0AAE1HZP8_9NEOP|nr:Protein SLY1 [Frankliniella fusca]